MRYRVVIQIDKFEPGDWLEMNPIEVTNTSLELVKMNDENSVVLIKDLEAHVEKFMEELT